MANEANLKPPWPKGTSGNPAGRAPGSSVTARLRAIAEAVSLGGKPIPGGKTVADLVAETVVREALKGDVRFVHLFLDRTEGKVPDTPPQGDGATQADLVRDFLANERAGAKSKGESKSKPKRKTKGGGGGTVS